ncbi:chlorophyll synthase ChlG [Roseomonas sp. CCTCC AB2023176]|uniref:chlorophyll synthase ChlG n=1 Tax=Roseomonas sp. CCTCC AB2023176 TaxID=3342640 RepID=UPI0035DDCAB1
MSGAATLPTPTRRFPEASAVLELLKPVTWFPPVFAFACGVVSSGAPLADRWPMALLGLLLAGPMVCGMSQAVNDWFDRHVDAVNEPHRPIPSGRMPGRWGLYVAVAWTLLSLLVALPLGPWGFAAAVVAIAFAWAYSAPPIRLKANGWWGNLACGACYEGLPWITAAAVMAGGTPSTATFAAAALYSLGAHGIMTLNDFKSVEGDRRFGIGSLPVLLGPERAGRVACVFMAVPQAVVAALLLAWGAPWHAAVVAVLLAGQVALMARLLRDPRGLAPWYNGTGVLLFVTGMMVTATAIRAGIGA